MQGSAKIVVKFVVEFVVEKCAIRTSLMDVVGGDVLNILWKAYDTLISTSNSPSKLITHRATLQ